MPSDFDIQRSYMRQQQLMDVVESPFKTAVFKAKNKYIRETARYYENHGVLSDQLFSEHQTDMEQIFRVYTKRIMVFMSKEMNMMLRKQESRIEMFFREWFMLFGAQRARNVAGTTREDIRNALIASQTGDEPEVPAIKRILRARGISAYRADVIARTETHNAAMEASVRSAKDVESETGQRLMKQWIPVQDGRTRDAHAAMSGSAPIDMDEKFLVNGERVDRPGQGSSANAINCRCVLVYSTE